MTWTLRTGSGAPGTIAGQTDGDNYIDTNNKYLYQLVAGTWTYIGNLSPISLRESGMTISNNGSDANNDIDIAAGSKFDSTGVIAINGSAMTKRLDASWAAGTNQGGLFSGSKANSTWYYVHVIRKDSDGSIDVGFDTSATAANKPAGYTYYRRIGAIRTDGSGNILGFIQNGNYFQLKTQVLSVNDGDPGTSRVLGEVIAPPSMVAVFTAALYCNDNTATYAIFTSPDATDSAPSPSLYTLFAWNAYDLLQTIEIQRIVDSSSRIGYRSSRSSANVVIKCFSIGWIDTGL